jgi:tagatose-1,6-bisphosphate aldolase non-catalytic subunit AgaZ/GatZ
MSGLARYAHLPNTSHNALMSRMNHDPAGFGPNRSYGLPSACSYHGDRLVSSRALAARMDPEDLREVISAVAETVDRFGGFGGATTSGYVRLCG